MRTLLHRLLVNARAAIDLASIMVGVIVIALIAGALSASVFAVIPWGQNQAARSELDEVRKAESVAKLPDPANPLTGKYLNHLDLDTAGFKKQVPLKVAVGTNATGSCWLAVSKSAAGPIFYATDKTTEIKEAVSGADPYPTCKNLDQLVSDDLGGYPPSTAPNTFTTLAMKNLSTMGSTYFGTTAQSDDGKNVVAAGGGYLWTSTDYGRSWAKRMTDTSRSWYYVDSDKTGTKLVAANGSSDIWVSSDSGANWTATSAGAYDYSGVTIADDGQHIVAVSRNSAIIRYSANFGTTWTTTRGGYRYLAAAASPDGKYVVVGSENYGEVLRSADYGATWTSMMPASSNEQWASVSVDATGQTLIVSSNTLTFSSSTVYTSINGGASWVLASGVAQSAQVKPVSVSADGKRMFVINPGATNKKFDFDNPGAGWVNSGTTIGNLSASYDGLRLIAAPSSDVPQLSADGGAIWGGAWMNQVSNVVGVSGDGKVVAVANTTASKLYISTDSGASWNIRQPPGTAYKYFTSVALDRTGRNIIAAANGNNGVYIGGVWTSADFGATWTEHTDAYTPGSANYTNKFAAISPDGSKMVVGTDGYGVYTKDGAAGWVSRTATSGTSVYGVSMTNDGQKIALQTSTYLKVSTNAGATWTTNTASGNVSAYTEDGSKLYGTASSKLSVSTNNGGAWTILANSPVTNWNSLAVSEDGSKIFAYTSAGFYTSNDSGATWVNVAAFTGSVNRLAGNLVGDWAFAVDGSFPGRLLSFQFTG